MNAFEKLGLSSTTVAAVTKKGFKTPSPIQEKTIPLLLKGDHDVIAQAQTGTGKTACFALPILEKITKEKHVQALILTPTRELALQVATEIESLKGDRHFRIAAIYGGANIKTQMDELKRGVSIVVGTPGRVMDLIERRKLILDNISYAVLDEADEMLNMGFIDDIEKILSQTNRDKKMLLFSATMPKEILRIAQKFMHNYKQVKDETIHLATDLIDQMYFDIAGRDRYTALRRLIAHTPDFHGLVFCKTRGEVDTVTKKLMQDNYAAAAIHGEISQSQREHSLKQFRDKRINILIATDVAARGIDVNDLNVVINYSLPQSPETYVHRIGRTGRAGNKGTAITFVMPSEKGKLKFVERIIKQKIPKGKLPSVKDILDSKKSHIETTIKDLMSGTPKAEYMEIATRLLSEGSSEEVVEAVLRYAFTNQLDSKEYKEVEEIKDSGRGDRSGRDRSSRGGRDRRGSGGGFRGQGRDSRSGSRREGGDRRSSGSDRRGSSRSSFGSRDRKGNSDGRSKPRSSEGSSGQGRDGDSKGSFKPRGERKDFKKPSGDRKPSGNRGGRDRSSSSRGGRGRTSR